MDKSKYLAEQLLSDNVGSRLNMRLITILEPDGKTWKVSGACDYALTMDGEHWGTGKVGEIMAYDTSVGNGISTVMYSIMKIVGDPEFLTQLGEQVEIAERLDEGEAK